MGTYPCWLQETMEVRLTAVLMLCARIWNPTYPDRNRTHPDLDARAIFRRRLFQGIEREQADS